MKGEVVYLYAFDVANEIMMDKVQEILKSKPFHFEIRTDHTYPRDVPLYKPLAIETPPLKFMTDGLFVRPQIRVYDVGVVAIALRVSLEFNSLDELMPLHNPKLADGESLDETARGMCEDVRESIAGALIKGSAPDEPYAYTVFCLTDVAAVEDVNVWLAEKRSAVAGLLTETDANILSNAQVNEVLRIQCSYTKKDVVVIDWDAALVIDLTGYVDDVLFALELANLQLEEYHTMDRRLDKHVNRAYEDLKVKRGIFGRDAAILRTIRLFQVDVTKLNDEVTNITKFVGDWYLARVYVGARERFHLNQWRSSVDERLGHLLRLYTVLHEDVSNRRMFWLEMLVVVFFLIDLLEIFFLKR